MKKLFITTFIFLALPLAAQASVSVGQANTTSLQNGLVGWWTLDGSKTNWNTNTTQDSSGNGNTGTLIQIATSTASTSGPVAGKIGQALKFDGVNSQIPLPQTASLKPAQWTISVWTYPTAGCTLSCAIFHPSYSNGYNGGFLLYIGSTGLPGLRWGDGTSVVGSIAYTTSVLNKWHHLTGTFDGTTISLYVDGVLRNSANASTYGYLTVTQAVIGNSSGTALFQGRLDDIRFYNRALSAQEVAQLYAMGGGVIGHSNTISLSSGLVGYWTLDGSKTNWNTNTTQDSSGNSNTGTLIQVATSTASTSGPVAGEIGQAMKFNGNNVISTAQVPAMTTLSVSAWAKFTGTAAFRRYAVAQISTVTTYDWGLSNDSTGLMVMRVFNAPTNGSTLGGANSAASNYNDGKWHHFVGTINKATGVVQIYADGVLSAATTQSLSTWAPASANVAIGDALTPPTGQGFNGSIDDVRIYSRVLSAQEVAQLYVLGGGVIGHSNTVSLSSGLVGYWTLDGSKTNWATNITQDSSGNGNAGTLVGIATSTKFATSSGPVAGKIGQALKFNGSTSYIFANTAHDLSLNGTISAWVNVKDVSTNQIIVSDIYSSTNRHFINISSGNVIAGYYDGSDHASSGSITTGWHHLVAVFSGTNPKLYIDGISQSGATAGSSGATVGVSVGARTSALNFFNGSIDDVRIYNRALSSQEVAQLYAMGK